DDRGDDAAVRPDRGPGGPPPAAGQRTAPTAADDHDDGRVRADDGDDGRAAPQHDDHAAGDVAPELAWRADGDRPPPRAGRAAAGDPGADDHGWDALDARGPGRPRRHPDTDDAVTDSNANADADADGRE